MKLSEASEGEYVVIDIEGEARDVLYKLGVVKGSVIEVEIRTRSSVVIALKPLGRIAMSRSTAELVEVESI